MARPLIGSKPMTYSEILRVIGHYMDRHSLSEARVLETSDGFILQGVVMLGERAGQHETYQLTIQDVEDLQGDAAAQRGGLI